MNNYWKLRLAIFAVTSTIGLIVRVVIAVSHSGPAHNEQVAVATDDQDDEMPAPVARPVSAPMTPAPAPGLAPAPAPAFAPAPAPAVAAAPRSETPPSAGENASAANAVPKAADDASQAKSGSENSAPLPYAPAPPVASTPTTPSDTPTTPPGTAPSTIPSPTTPPYSMPPPSTNTTPSSSMPLPPGTNTTPPSSSMPPAAGSPSSETPAMPATTAPPANAQGPAQGAVGQPGMGNLSRAFAAGAKAAEDFIAAIEAQDPAAILNATALRSRTETSANNHSLFEAILDEKLTDDDLTKLSEMFSGYKVVDIHNAKSVGRLLIIVDKTTRNEEYQRTIIVRKEAAGWRVVDFSNRRNFGPGRGLRPKTNKK